MLKRPLSEEVERAEGLSNGNKIARVGASSEPVFGEPALGHADDEEARLRKLGQRPKAPSLPQRTDEKLPLILYSGGEPLLQAQAGDVEKRQVEVRIPAGSLSTSNRQVRARQLWGVNVYTNDSDVVAVLMHCGYLNNAFSIPPGAASEMRAVVQILPPQPSYPSCARNGIRSRAWGATVDALSYKVERCQLILRGGEVVEMAASPDGSAVVVPTFTPAHFERVMNTRASASSVERRQRTMQEITVQYNLSNEPWLKYSMAAIADRGLKPSQLTSARLRAEVLYLETVNTRYELSLADRPTAAAAAVEQDPTQVERYRWARCKKALPLAKMRALGIPLPEEHAEVLEAGLTWEEMQWSPTGVHIKERHYPIMRLHFTAATDIQVPRKTPSRAVTPKPEV